MSNVINFEQVRQARNTRKCQANILPATDQSVGRVISSAGEHTSEPIKEITDIRRVCDFLLREKRWRDHMMFVVGINFGLRISDLLSLRFCDILEEDGTFKTELRLIEKKTEHTRSVKKNRYVAINDAVMDSVEIYLTNVPNVHMDDFLFRSESNRGVNSGKALDRKSVDRILKGIAEDCGLRIHFSSHSLRKTFGYHQMAMSGNDPRKLVLLQKMFGHSSMTKTLCYIGITDEEMTDAYRSLNLGGRDYATTKACVAATGIREAL